MRSHEKEIMNIVAAFILKMIDLYSWTSICTVKAEYSQVLLYLRRISEIPIRKAFMFVPEMCLKMRKLLCPPFTWKSHS